MKLVHVLAVASQVDQGIMPNTVREGRGILLLKLNHNPDGTGLMNNKMRQTVFSH